METERYISDGWRMMGDTWGQSLRSNFTEREIVAVDRPIGVPRGERIVREVAAEYGITVAQLRRQWGPRRHVPARIEVARRLDAIGYSGTLIGRILNRHPSSICWYLGHTSQRPPLNTPGMIVPRGWRQDKILAVLTDQYMSVSEIIEAAGITDIRPRDLVSNACRRMRLAGLIERGEDEEHKPMWRRK